MGAVHGDLNALRVLIVGCGNIGGGFDQGRPSGYLPYTHAGAYVRDGRFKIAMCVEPDDDQRKAFIDAWGVPSGVRSIEELDGAVDNFDVVSICSPTSNHASDLGLALHWRPKLVFCEKPVTTTLQKTENIVDEYRKAHVLLAVNHTRRWDPYLSELQTDIDAGRWGALRSVVGIYNKGILNNGSHMLDLLHLLCGSITVVKVGKPVYDFFLNDPTIPAWLESEMGVPVHLACANAGDYAVFELQLIFSHGILSMEDGGMFWRERRATDSAAVKGYRKLEDDVRRPGGYPQSMLQAVDNIYGAVQHGAVLASTGESALAAQRVCEQIRQMACEL